MFSSFAEGLPVMMWELNRVLKRKDFIVSVLLTPLLALGTGFIVGWTKQRQENQQQRVAVVLEAPASPSAAAPLPPLEGFTWVRPAAAEATPEALAESIRQKQLDGALWLPSNYAEGGKARLLVRREAPGWKRKLETHLQEQARVARAAHHGVTLDELKAFDAPVAVEEQLAVPRERTSKGDRIAAMISIMLVIMTIFITGSYMTIGITGEKQSRMTEVIVSAIRPQAWIDGKIAAYTLIGLLQALLWMASGVIIALLFARSLPPSMNAGMIAVFALFMVLGLTFYTALYALVTATIKDLQSTQKFQAYLFFLPMIPMFFLQGAVESPDAPWVMAISILPPFAPMLMPMRLAVSGAAPWEPVVAIAGLLVASYLMRVAAGHAFRIGMLLYGKEVSLPELVRWSRRQ